MTHNQAHVPVLLDAFMTHINPRNQIWVDATYGNGGYSHAIIKSGAAKVIALDCDPDAKQRYRALPEYLKEKIVFVPDWFGNLDQNEIVQSYLPVDGIVFDLGISSIQLNDRERGFSFAQSGPLDMRMDNRKGTTAADVVNTYSENDLVRLLIENSEEKHAKRIAKGIIRKRLVEPIKSTTELAQIVQESIPSGPPKKINPATKTFMALRIEVNQELKQLDKGLKAAERALKPSGIIAAISFHSLEDRKIKFFLQPPSKQNRYQPEVNSKESSFSLINNKPITATQAELAINPRSRSAKLRMARKKELHSNPSDKLLQHPVLNVT